MLRRAVELGVNHIDTAGFYRRGSVQANELIRTALAPYPDDLVIATKVGPLLGPQGVPTHQATPERLRGLVEADLQALGLDRLDLVYLRVGGMSPPGGESIAERFAVLADLRAQGLIRHLGVSNMDAAQLAEARAIAPIAAVQNRYTADMALLAECEDSGIAYVPYFPLGGGISPVGVAASQEGATAGTAGSGSSAGGGGSAGGGSSAGGGGSAGSERLGKVAARLGATTAQVAIALLLATSPSVLAIPGTGSLDHLEENLAAGDLSLSEQDLSDLRG